MRGKVFVDGEVWPLHRITPACAGKSSVPLAVISDSGDHPRVCGEKKKAEEMGATTKGSPPRMRGKAFRVGLAGRILGITPACAGKSLLSSAGGFHNQDHPRVCGEKTLAVQSSVEDQGSPPPVRGKDFQIRGDVGGEGITPACAGKSRSTSYPQQRPRDHPRVCGEKGALAGWAAARAGSPPRVRGKALQAIPAIMSEGITPACAGKRIGRLQCRTSRKDHPRVCGEKQILPPGQLARAGSPPRVRGKVGLFVCALCTDGITPACAGKSDYFSSTDQNQKDHPRVCGEKGKTV